MKTHFWFLFERAEDVPDAWVAHCLDLDVVTYGVSLQHALEMVLEATRMVLDHDAAVGRDSLDRRAPDEYWEKLDALRKAPKMRIPVALLGSRQEDVKIVAAELEVPKEIFVSRPPNKRSRAKSLVTEAPANVPQYTPAALAM